MRLLAKFTPAARTVTRAGLSRRGGGLGRCGTCKTDELPCLVMATASIVSYPDTASRITW